MLLPLPMGEGQGEGQLPLPVGEGRCEGQLPLLWEMVAVRADRWWLTADSGSEVNMKELRLRLQTVTPLFLAGADPRGAPELRPPAFRGALRYWLRAALGGAFGDDGAGLKSVRAAEAAVFGSAGESDGTASAVTVRVLGEMPPPLKYQRGRGGRDPATGRLMPSGRDYLFWSMAETGSPERGSYQAARQYWPPGIAFELELLARPGAPNGEEALQQAVAALWLLVHLGGIGARSRRAAGSLSPVTPAREGGLPFGLQGRTTNEVARELADGLGRVRALFRPLGQRSPSVPPEFDVLHPQGCRVWALGVWPSAEMAVEEVGAAMRDFRSRREPDHRNVARWLNGDSIPTVERAAFGLPLPFRYTYGPSAVVQGAGELDRRASPLWLKVSRSPGGYVGVATLFASRFLPQGADLNARGQRAPAPSGYTLLERFIAERFTGALEVNYV